MKGEKSSQWSPLLQKLRKLDQRKGKNSSNYSFLCHDLCWSSNADNTTSGRLLFSVCSLSLFLTTITIHVLSLSSPPQYLHLSSTLLGWKKWQCSPQLFRGSSFSTCLWQHWITESFLDAHRLRCTRPAHHGRILVNLSMSISLPFFYTFTKDMYIGTLSCPLCLHVLSLLHGGACIGNTLVWVQLASFLNLVPNFHPIFSTSFSHRSYQ